MDIQKSAIFKDILKFIIGYPKIMLNLYIHNSINGYP